MRGIRFIRELSKEFKIPFDVYPSHNACLTNIKFHPRFMMTFRRNKIIISIHCRNNKYITERFKYSEKYKIKQLIYEALSK